jgi:hypothetical protein
VADSCRHGEKTSGSNYLTRLVTVSLSGRTLLHGGRWKDHIKMDFREIGCGDMDWIELVQWWIFVNRYWASRLRKSRKFIDQLITVNF